MLRVPPRLACLPLLALLAFALPAEAQSPPTLPNFDRRTPMVLAVENVGPAVVNLRTLSATRRNGFGTGAYGESPALAPSAAPRALRGCTGAQAPRDDCCPEGAKRILSPRSARAPSVSIRAAALRIAAPSRHAVTDEPSRLTPSRTATGPDAPAGAIRRPENRPLPRKTARGRGGLRRSLREALYPEPSKAQHGTVQRLLQRLGEKGYVSRQRMEHAHVFRPTLSREEYAGTQLESLADKLTGGSLAPMLTHLLETKKLSGSEIDRLRALLEEDPHRKDASQ